MSHPLSFGAHGDIMKASPQSLVQFVPKPTEPKTHQHACVLCAHRKVKCDRIMPRCSNCIKSKHDCEYRIPPPPQRRKRKAPGEETVESRLSRAEELLKANGIELDRGDGTSGDKADGSADPLHPDGHRPGADSPSHKPHGTLLMLERGRSRYLEGNFWAGLKDQVPNAGELLEDSDDEAENGGEADVTTPSSIGMLFTSPNSVPALYGLHPTKDNSKRIWSFYAKNCNPLIMIHHLPTKKIEYDEAIEKIGYLTKAQEAILFSIYLTSVTSMTEVECRTHLGEERRTLVDRYTEATKIALVGANFLRTLDLGVLQSYVLYLICMRLVYDSGTFWTLTGIAVRIAQRIGLHHDGDQLGASAFEAEIRRRTWWPLLLLDLRATELAGAESVLLGADWDTKMPANLNNDELYPEMEKLPPEHAGATDMIHCRIRYEMFETMRRFKFSPNSKHTGLLPCFDEKAKERLAARDTMIDELQQHLEKKYLRYCDVLNPLHFAASVVARTFITGMRLMTHHPRQYEDRGESLPESERDKLFELGIKVIEYFNICLTTPSLGGYLWHVKSHATWHPLIYIIGELRNRTYGMEVDHAWEELEKAFLHIPIFDRVPGRALFRSAMTNIILSAYEARVKTLEAHGQSPKPSQFINDLYDFQTKQKQRAARKSSKSMTSPGSNSEPTMSGSMVRTPDVINGQGDFNGIPNALPIESSNNAALDWTQWDELITGNYGMPLGIEDNYFNPVVQTPQATFNRFNNLPGPGPSLS